MHIDVYCGIAVPGGAVIAFNRGIYYVDCLSGKVHREHTFVPPDMRRPFNFYEIKGVSNFNECLVYGEYMFNRDLREVSIYGRTIHEDSHKWDKLYTFPPNTIRHIHSIIPDPYRDRVIICTGDNDEEAAIWAAYDNFSRVEKLLGGDQQYRICCARAYPEGLLLTTDSPYFENFSYVLTEAEGKIQLKPLCKLPGPTVFFTCYKDLVVIGTDVEYDERRVNAITRYATYRRGPGVKDWYAHLLIGNIQQGFREIIKLRKDLFPMGALGFGGISFPNGTYPGKIYFYPYGVYHGDHLCYVDIVGE